MLIARTLDTLRLRPKQIVLYWKTFQNHLLIWKTQLKLSLKSMKFGFQNTAFRSGEISELKKENVNLREMTITGGKKTIAGHMRVIPIHPRIQSYVKNLMKGPSEYLPTGPLGGKLSIRRIENEFKWVSEKYCDRIHIPHECRHTLQTRLDMMGADKICIDMLMGHKPANVADRVYSHRSLEDLRKAILLLW